MGNEQIAEILVHFSYKNAIFTKIKIITSSSESIPPRSFLMLIGWIFLPLYTRVSDQERVLSIKILNIKESC